MRVIWSRGTKRAKTEYQVLTPQQSVAVFDEKFQINTVLELYQDTLMPVKEKPSKLTLALDKSQNSVEIAEVEFNMTNFKYDEYNLMKLSLKQCSDQDQFQIDEEDSWIEIGLKATKKDGLVQQRMTAMQQKMADKLLEDFKGDKYKETLKRSGLSPEKMRDVQYQSQMNDAITNMIKAEQDKLKKEKKQYKQEYEKKLNLKDAKINELETKLQNMENQQDLGKNENQNELYSQISERQTVIDELTQKYQKSEAKVDDYSKRLANMGKTLVEVQAEVAQYQSQLAAQQTTKKETVAAPPSQPLDFGAFDVSFQNIGEKLMLTNSKRKKSTKPGTAADKKKI